LELITLIGFATALLIGLILGLIGGGGSIVTVPVLVYLLEIDPVTATAYSLFLVGAVSTVGTFRNAQLGTINYRVGLVFSLPAFTAVYLTRAYIIPAIPDNITTLGHFQLTKDLAIMLFFAFIMVIASISMIGSKDRKPLAKGEKKLNLPLILIEGGIVGFVTGLVGAGGGFLIIPALVLLANLEIKTAIGTSLLIIAIKSTIGFLGDVQNIEVDWSFLLLFTAMAVGGIFIGLTFNQKLGNEPLKKIFGWFILLMGVGIFIKEIVL